MFERLELSLARFVAGLPPELQIRLSGKPLARADGDSLQPELQILLALRGLLSRKSMRERGVVESRARMRQKAALYCGPAIELASVTDLMIDGGGASIRARHYVPFEKSTGGKRPLPLLVFFHGGGFVLGDLDSHDAPCRFLCQEAQIQVLSVEYRLAPEHPFPAAVEDAVAAFRWAHANAASLGADPVRVGVGGDSAGGNLAAVVAQVQARDRGPMPVLQLLIYPPTDLVEERASMVQFGNGFLLNRTDLSWFVELYASQADVLDPRLSPLRSPDLSGLPPTLLFSAAFDPLRDEGEVYATALSAAGCQVKVKRLPGLVHGFISLLGFGTKSRAGLAEIAAITQAEFTKYE